jgi:mono/diheme cytochrome c family protein
MKRSWILRVATVGFVSGLLFGTVALGQAEPKAQSDELARGKTLFVMYCTGCHGPQGGGDGYRFLRGPDPANLTLPSIRKKSDADLFKTIHDGKPNMPDWKVRLSEEESRDVLAYVRTLAK